MPSPRWFKEGSPRRMLNAVHEPQTSVPIQPRSLRFGMSHETERATHRASPFKLNRHVTRRGRFLLKNCLIERDQTPGRSSGRICGNGGVIVELECCLRGSRRERGFCRPLAEGAGVFRPVNDPRDRAGFRAGLKAPASRKRCAVRVSARCGGET